MAVVHIRVLDSLLCLFCVSKVLAMLGGEFLLSASARPWSSCSRYPFSELRSRSKSFSSAGLLLLLLFLLSSDLMFLKE